MKRKKETVCDKKSNSNLECLTIQKERNSTQIFQSETPPSVWSGASHDKRSLLHDIGARTALGPLGRLLWIVSHAAEVQALS